MIITFGAFVFMNSMSPKYAPSRPTCPICLTSPCGQDIMSILKRLRRDEYFESIINNLKM